ncbi:Creb3 [Columba guinea]|nr:Creb3 [Columba guinea]
MSCPEELSALADEDLLEFLLKDDAPCLEIPGEEDGLLEDWGLPEPGLLDKEMDDFISSLLSPFEDEPVTLQGYTTDSSVYEDQQLSHTSSGDFANSPRSSDIVQVDHNYSLHQDWPVLESVRSEMAEGDVSIDLGPWTDLEGSDKALEQSSGFLTTVAVDAKPQLVPEAIVQSDFPELVLTEEEKQLLEKEGVSLPTCLPLTKVSPCYSLVAACTAQNQRLEKKVQLLQEQNMSLLKQLRKLQALVIQSTTKTATAKSCTMVLVLSFCFILSPNICSLGGREPQPELRVLSRQIREFPNQAAPEVQEKAALQGLIPEPEDPSLLGSLSQSWEEKQSPPNPDLRSSFYSNSSSDPPATAGSELGPPQPQEQLSQSDSLQAAMLAAWKAKRQEWMEGAARVVIQQHHANEM